MTYVCDRWPWINGVCRCSPHDTRPIQRCWLCNEPHCTECELDSCRTCGYPLCQQCKYSSTHLRQCHHNALLRHFPLLQCRHCDRPQDIGIWPSCARCLRPQCQNTSCRSQIRRTHCRCRQDLCQDCAGWLLFRLFSTHRLGNALAQIPTPSRQRTHLTRWLYYCFRCQ